MTLARSYVLLACLTDATVHEPFTSGDIVFLSFRIALASLKAHKLRTALAMLGVFLGALALTGVQHVSLAMVRKAEIETEKLGPNLFMATAGQVRMVRSGSARVSGGARTFTVQDAMALILSLPAARGGVPFISTTMGVRHGSVKTTAQLVASWPAYTRIRSFQPQYGRFFTQQELDERAKVCVLGRTVAERLFGNAEAAVGQHVFVFRARLEVLGVMEEKGQDIAGTDQDEQFFVPLTTYMRRMANQDWITGAYLQLADGADSDAAKRSAEALLRDRHDLQPGQNNDFSLVTAKDTMELQQQALDLVSTLGLISSSLSFGVGGLGILSIMVLLVRARQLEIGVRRATGARRRDILRQFLLEAGFMSTAGGGAGVAAAMALMTAVYTFAGFPYVYDPGLLAGALAGSGALGIIAGAYPAWRASRLEILDVLRDT